MWILIELNFHKYEVNSGRSYAENEKWLGKKQVRALRWLTNVEK